MTEMNFSVEIPKIDSIQQGEEFFIVDYNDQREKIRAHDYDKIYSVPGLYEYLFYDTYKCCSPDVVASLLKQRVDQTDMDFSDLKVLDVGAGNGMMGEQLINKGADAVLGLDIIEEALEAAERDRPGIYDNYFIEDLTRLPGDVRREIQAFEPNCLTVVAALGFDDIPPGAFVEAFNMIDKSGWVAFNIKDEFVCETDCTGFSKLIQQMEQEEIMKIQARRQYRHRLCQDGTPLHYFAIVGQKQKKFPDEMLDQFLS